MRKFWTMGAAALVAMAGGVFADDTSTMREEIADLRAKVSALETAEMAPAAGGDCESLTSMKKKGTIKIGGDVELDVSVVSRDDLYARGAAAAPTEDDNVDSTYFGTADADLNFQVNANQDTYLFIKLDVDDSANQAVDQDDLLEECYFAWKKVRGSAFDLRFGKGEVAYGQDKDVVVTDSYHHNSGTGSYLGAAREEVGALATIADEYYTNQHRAVGNFAHPGEVDNVFMGEMAYTWKDLLKVEASVFQNPYGNTTVGNSVGGGRATRGMHEDRSDDTLFFQSYASRVTYTPMENLKLMASWINQHNDSAGDVQLNTGNAADDQYATSLAFDWTMKSLPLEFFGEYQHGWDYNFSEEYSVDIAQIGVIWGVTEPIDLVAEIETMAIDANGGPGGAVRGDSAVEQYWKAVAAAKYTFDSGIYVALEYCHEWYSGVAEDTSADADAIAFRTAWSF